MSAPVRLRSKRNRVEKVPIPGEGQAWSVVKDFGENKEGFETELRTMQRLLGAGAVVAPILQVEEPVIVYRWLEGTPLADLLDQAEEGSAGEALLRQGLEALCTWLEKFYAVGKEAGEPWVLGDAHLRNFLLLEDGTVAGVDFECCRPGRPEGDIARLAVFTAAYDPAWTPAKVRLASFLLEECRKRLGLDPVFLERQAAEELAAMARRRKCVMDPALLEPVLEPLRKSRPSFKDTD